MFEIIFLSLTGIYFLILAVISSGLSRKLKLNKNFTPFVSVIIAARNEERNILSCLNSLNNQDYQKNKFEVIIADDSSTDKTGSIIDSFIVSHTNFKKIIPSAGNILYGKANALKSAITNSTGEILLFTDADCTVPEKWISTIVQYYSGGTGMVNSFSIVPAVNLFTGIQNLDYLFLIGIAGGMANNGFPASCIGNNMSVKRSVYKETGGYDNIPVSVTEDYALLNSINKLNKYEIIFPVDKELLVITEPCRSLGDLIKQKKRWASGGLKLFNKSILLMSAAYLTNLMMILSFFFFSSQVLSIMLFKIISEFFFLYHISKKLGILNNLKYFLFFEIYYIVYTTFLPIVFLFSREITWKDRKY
jgi:cellulose synthase/poly-beta-1,6-N-acetylglucosamine synthase-like glycosyltransferase